MNSAQNVIEANANQHLPAPKESQQSSSVSIDVVSADDLCGSLLERWNRLRASSKVYDSPYFDAEFVKAVARVRDDVRILLAEQDGEVISFLPIQENSPRNAVPAGGLLNDWHGLIGSGNVDLMKMMLEKANIKSYKFHALEHADGQYEDYCFREYQSHFLDLSDGWEHYRKWAFKNSSTIKRQGQKTRALAREVGEIRFDFHSDSTELLERLIDLKRSRYQRSNTFDILSVPWAADLLREIHKIQKTDFQGLLSSYWAGDQLVGVHFGMKTDKILHYWFPVYDPAFQRYSPGTEMLMRAAEEACSRGIEKLDLGYGDDAYKFKFCNGHEDVAFGLVNFSPFLHAISKRKYIVRNQLKGIPFKPYVKRMLRSVFPGFGGWNFR